MTDYDAAVEVRDAICSVVEELTQLRRVVGLGVLLLADAILMQSGNNNKTVENLKNYTDLITSIPDGEK